MAAFGGNGVAAYQHHACRVTHNGFAAMFVLTAIAHFRLESRIERQVGLSSGLARATRRSLVLIATIGCAMFISHVVFEETYGISVGIGKFTAASAEIVTCFCLIIYLATYYRSFHETKITLTVAVPKAMQPPETNARFEPSLLLQMPTSDGLRRSFSADAMLHACKFGS